MSLRAIQKQYDDYAEEYSRNIESSMQLGNLRNLINYLSPYTDFSKGTWLDAGCGPGCLSHIKSAQLHPDKLIGIDISPNMIKIAKKSKFYNECQISNISEIKSIQSESIDTYISNTVLHWLNLAGSIKQAIREAHRILKPNGIIAVSLSGLGTAKQLMEAYHKIVEENITIRKEFNKKNPEGIIVDFILDDVLGSENLHTIVDLFEECGFHVELARLEFEPVLFEKAENYIDTVEQYGRHLYLMPFQHLDRDTQSNIFLKIRREFIKKVGAKNYRHKQYMIYLIAKKLST